MRATITINLTITELKDVQNATKAGMDAMKEKIGQMEQGNEKSLTIHQYKELEKFNNSLMY